MGLGGKLKASVKERVENYKQERREEKAFRKIEKQHYKDAERSGRLERAKKEGYKSGRTQSRSKVSMVAKKLPRVSIRTDGPDPFGLFGEKNKRLASVANVPKKKSKKQNDYWSNLA
jgi:hypothetical protein